MPHANLIFLCHAKEDIIEVKALHNRLQSSGFRPWLDENDILYGQKPDDEIRKIIRQAEFALICVSETSVQKRGYIQKEIKWALDRQDEMLEDDIFLIVVKLEECTLPESLSAYQWCDLFQPDGFERLLKALHHQMEKRGTPALDSGFRRNDGLNTGRNDRHSSSGLTGRRCFIEIRKSGNTLSAAVHHGNPAEIRFLTELKLDNHAPVPIRNKSLKMAHILKTMIQAGEKDLAQFDDAFQVDMGQYLFRQLFPEPAGASLPSDIDLHITTSLPHLLLLPWHVLSHKRMFLSSAGWTVSLSDHPELKSCTLPDNPRLLAVIPQPAGKAGTNAKAHLEKLADELSARNHAFALGQNLEVVYTWEEFSHKLETFSPHAVYYYGHCTDGVEKTKLCLATGSDHRECCITPNEFLTGIEKMRVKPVMIYLNCLNISAGLINFGMSLGRMVPAVITSRYLYSSETACEQGLRLLLDILTRGIAPHRAVAGLYGNISSTVSTSRTRWMTPVLFRSYDEWKAPIPETPSRRIHDPHWHLKIDRVTQFSTVAAQTLQMVKEGRPRSQAFVWYGTEGQGVERFHHRLNVELREYLLNFNTHIYEIRPEWPRELERPETAFRDCLLEAFEVRHMDDIPAAIRKMSQGASGRQTLVYVRHLPVRSPRLINPKSLKTYLQWWDTSFLPLLERTQFALLGISFIVNNNPPKFRNLILKTERIEDLNLKHTVFRLLDEMEKLAARDILDFFKTHNIRLPVKNRDILIEKILEKTKGHYEQTVKQLQILVEQS